MLISIENLYTFIGYLITAVTGVGLVIIWLLIILEATRRILRVASIMLAICVSVAIWIITVYSIIFSLFAIFSIFNITDALFTVIGYISSIAITVFINLVLCINCKRAAVLLIFAMSLIISFINIALIITVTGIGS